MLANGYYLRQAIPADMPGIADLITAFEAMDAGDIVPTTPAGVLADWQGLNPASDIWVVVAPDGTLGGYGRVTLEGIQYSKADNYVHPQCWGRGIGMALVQAIEARSDELGLMASCEKIVRSVADLGVQTMCE